MKGEGFPAGQGDALPIHPETATAFVEWGVSIANTALAVAAGCEAVPRAGCRVRPLRERLHGGHRVPRGGGEGG